VQRIVFCREARHALALPRPMPASVIPSDAQVKKLRPA
jgi:hypothetical protein